MNTVAVSWNFRYLLEYTVNVSAGFATAVSSATEGGFSTYTNIPTEGFHMALIRQPDDEINGVDSVQVESEVRVELDGVNSGEPGVASVSLDWLRVVWADLVDMRDESTDLDRYNSGFTPAKLSIVKEFVNRAWSLLLESQPASQLWASETMLGNSRHVRLRSLQLSCGSSAANVCQQLNADIIGTPAPAIPTSPGEGSGFDAPALPFIIMAIAMFLVPLCFGRKCMRMLKRCSHRVTAPRPNPAARQAAALGRRPGSHPALQATQVPKAIVEKFQNHKTHEILLEIKGNKDDQCVICLGEFVDAIYCAVLPCGHVLHWRCWALWSARSMKCPMCRIEPQWEEISKVMWTAKEDEAATTRDMGDEEATMGHLASELEAVRRELGLGDKGSQSGEERQRGRTASAEEVGDRGARSRGADDENAASRAADIEAAEGGAAPGPRGQTSRGVHERGSSRPKSSSAAAHQSTEEQRSQNTEAVNPGASSAEEAVSRAARSTSRTRQRSREFGGLAESSTASARAAVVGKPAKEAEATAAEQQQQEQQEEQQRQPPRRAKSSSALGASRKARAAHRDSSDEYPSRRAGVGSRDTSGSPSQALAAASSSTSPRRRGESPGLARASTAGNLGASSSTRAPLDQPEAQASAPRKAARSRRKRGVEEGSQQPGSHSPGRHYREDSDLSRFDV